MPHGGGDLPFVGSTTHGKGTIAPRRRKSTSARTLRRRPRRDSPKRVGVYRPPSGDCCAPRDCPTPVGVYLTAAAEYAGRTNCPTPVGVCRSQKEEKPVKKRLPHAGGGTPSGYAVLPDETKITPRRWGSTPDRHDVPAPVIDCPTPVGIHLNSMAASFRSRRLPHAGGGLPGPARSPPPGQAIAPRRWGSTVRPLATDVPRGDCPTPVGIYRGDMGPGGLRPGLPHAGGGLPNDDKLLFTGKEIASRRWGSRTIAKSARGLLLSP